MDRHNPEVCETRFNIIEERVKELKKRVETFDNIKEVLIELKILTTQQIEANAQRDEMLQEHGLALAKAIETLRDLSNKQDRHDNRLESLENRGNINVSELVKKVLYIGIGIVVTAIMSGVIK